MSIPFIIHRTLQEMTIPFTISLAVTDRAAKDSLFWGEQTIERKNV